VDDGENSLAKIAARAGIPDRFDLVSRDVDGLDYQIFSTLDEFRQPPLVVCVEVHTCHKPDDITPVPVEVAQNGCGQPMGRFVQRGREMGYRLVSFIGTNAIFVHADANRDVELPTMTAAEAAEQNLSLISENRFAKEYLFLCNLGKQQPHYRFNNPMFSRQSLGIGLFRAAKLLWTNKI
jgi:hypothetical protein